MTGSRTSKKIKPEKTWRRCNGLGCKPGEGFYSDKPVATHRICPKCTARQAGGGAMPRSKVCRAGNPASDGN